MVSGYTSVVDEPALRRRHPFASLVRPRVGLIEGVTFLPVDLGAVDLYVAATRLGNLSYTLENVATPEGTDVRNAAIGGGSADVDPEQSWVRAVVEAAERYSSMAFSTGNFVVASAQELGREAIDLRSIPRCSQEEYADPRCPLRPAPLEAPIRWVRGLSLLSSEDRFVPAVMTHLHLKPWAAERFWLPISTGVAAHTDLGAALVAAICENVERDALALTWLLERTLPRIETPSLPSPSLAAVLERLARSSVSHHAFDATTDCGIPTVLAVQITENDPSCEVFVSCATAMDPEMAFEKAIREASPARAVLRSAPPPPADVRDFTEITDGASYYGRTGHRADFDFLLGTTRRTTLKAMSRTTPAVERDGSYYDLAALLARMTELEMDPVAVDLTADEVRDAGLWVVRVVMPELVPISFVHRARYLGTHRLVAHERAARAPGSPGPWFSPHPLPFA